MPEYYFIIFTYSLLLLHYYITIIKENYYLHLNSINPKTTFIPMPFLFSIPTFLFHTADLAPADGSPGSVSPPPQGHSSTPNGGDQTVLSEVSPPDHRREVSDGLSSPPPNASSAPPVSQVFWPIVSLILCCLLSLKQLKCVQLNRF